MKKLFLILLMSACVVMGHADPVEKKIQLLSLLSQTNMYLTLEDYEQAAELRDQALVLFKELGADNDPNTIIELHKISHAYSQKGMYDDAIKTESLLVDVFPIAQPDNVKEYALYLNDLGFYSIAAKNLEKGTECVTKAIDILNNIDDKETIAAVYIRAAEVFSISDSTKIGYSIAYQQKAIDIYKMLFGEESNKTLAEIQYLVDYYEIAGMFENAYSTAKDLWNKKTKNEKNASDNILYYKNYVRLADICGDTLAVINNIQPLDSLAMDVYGEYSDEYINVLLENAVYLQHFRLYELSGNNIIKMLNVADSIHRDKLEPIYKYAYDFANNLQIIHQHKTSATILKYIIDKSSSFNFDKKHLLYATKIAYAQSLSRLGDISTALLITTELEEEAIRLYGTKSCAYAKLLSCKARCYAQLNDLENAIINSESAAEIEKSIEHSDHYAGELTWLGGYYYKNHQIEKALQCDLNSLTIYRELYGEGSSQVINIYTNILSLDLDWELCKKYYNIDPDSITSNIIDFYEKHPKDEHISPHVFFNYFANVFAMAGRERTETSHEFFSKALEIAKNRYGTDSKDYINILENYCFVCLIQEHPKISKYLSDLITLKKQELLNVIPYIDCSNREKLWTEESFWFDNFVSLCLSMVPSDTVSAIAYDANLFSKGFLLGTEVEIGRLIEEEGDYAILNAYNSLVTKKERLESLHQSNAPKQLCDSLENEINKDELFVLSMSKQYSSYMNHFKATWQDVQSILDNSDLAIEFTYYLVNDSTTVYAALTLCKNDTVPQLTKLFTESQLKTVSGNEGSYQNSIADSLIWGPLSSRLQDKTNIYFSASGILHNIGIEYLPSMDGKECYRLSSTRELVTHKPSSTISRATIYGGLDYDASSKELFAANQGIKVQPSLRVSSNLTAMRSLEESSLRAGCVPLEGTRREAEFISKELKNAGITAIVYKDSQGTEESFKALSGNCPSLLHIGTHGFYWTPDEAEQRKQMSDNMKFLGGDDKRVQAEDKALSRSGLMLAGCNRVFNNETMPEDLDDGILTAKEISQLDLRGLDLVVLSACETALGDISGSEGVFGLQRAFKKAGAQAIMMSLWKVDDVATENMMKFFYTHLAKGESIRQSFTAAQQELRAIDPDPRHWAAFILMDALD